VLIDPLAARVRKRYPVGIATAKVIARESSFRVEPSTLFQPSTWRTHPPGFRNGISVEAGGPEDESFPPCRDEVSTPSEQGSCLFNLIGLKTSVILRRHSRQALPTGCGGAGWRGLILNPFDCGSCNKSRRPG